MSAQNIRDYAREERELRAAYSQQRRREQANTAAANCPECGVLRVNQETLRAHRMIAHGADL